MRDFFRSYPWVDAWVETWGQDKRISLIDLGGAKNPLHMVYTTKHALKKIIPLKTLVLAGNGFGRLSTPRAEYNNLDSLIAAAGSLDALAKHLSGISYNQFALTDINSNSNTTDEISELCRLGNYYPRRLKAELAYSIRANNLPGYLAGLGSNTRSTYFNRRNRLAQQGAIEFTEYNYSDAHRFFTLLNAFHVPRWGTPCYSAESLRFLSALVERVHFGGGVSVLQAMSVNGEIVSVLFDIEWNGVRYNLQSGYKESRFPKIALGSIHFGYAIESAINKGLIYDFMAGVGKSSNYKQHIANQTELLTSYVLARGSTKWLYRLSGR